MTTYYTIYECPIQSILLTSNGKALTGLYLNLRENGVQQDAEWIGDSEVTPFSQAREQLDTYFKGKLTRFELPLAPVGTEFQKLVWNALTEIPCGETITYGELARRIGSPNASRAVGKTRHDLRPRRTLRRIGSPNASRAVGLANSRNPISIIVPCHRVIGASGKQTGYAGGIDNKAALLKLELFHSPQSMSSLFALTSQI